ncbi:MAG TPA: metallophosphoesterase [Candidatus Moranbacteria bacterium]|nr:metallophosphoesterase [Candidatus Moranbacteria bacterium]
MKFAILSDIHLGPEEYYKNVLRKINKNVKIFLDNFVEEINSDIKPNFLVVLGDLIQDENSTKDRNNLIYIIKLLKKINYPVYYVAGNHDLKNISEVKLARLFHQEKLYYSFDSGNFHFVVLFSKRSKDNTHFYISDEQKDWLRNDLDKTDKKCIVFVHYGLADQDLKGNPWFEGRPDRCLILNRKEIRDILFKSGKVISVFNSHLHWDKKDIHDNIPYFTIQSLVENENNKGLASEAYAIVNIKNNKVGVEIKGNYAKKL